MVKGTGASRVSWILTFWCWCPERWVVVRFLRCQALCEVGLGFKNGASGAEGEVQRPQGHLLW